MHPQAPPRSRQSAREGAARSQRPDRALRRANVRRISSLALLLLPLLLGACLTRGAATEPAVDAPDALEGLSASEVVDRAAEAMRRPGFVYHRVMQRRQEAEIYSNVGLFEYWLAPDGRQARKRYSMQLLARDAGQPLAGQEIVVDGEHFKTPEGGGAFEPSQDETPICSRLSAAESLVYNCRARQEVRWEVEPGRYDGRPAIVLTGRFHEPGDPEAEIQAEAYYLDPETFLPRYMLAEGVIIYGETTRYQVRATFEHDFIPLEDLPEGFFDPAAPAELPASPEMDASGLEEGAAEIVGPGGDDAAADPADDEAADSTDAADSDAAREDAP